MKGEREREREPLLHEGSVKLRWLSMCTAYLPCSWCHEAIRRLLSTASKSSHLGARNELVVVMIIRIIEIHCSKLCVVGCHFEGYYLKLG